jgi:hypothetical protein
MTSYPSSQIPLYYTSYGQNLGRITSDYYNTYTGPNSIDWNNQCYCTAACESAYSDLSKCAYWTPVQLCPFGCAEPQSAYGQGTSLGGLAWTL